MGIRFDNRMGYLYTSKGWNTVREVSLMIYEAFLGISKIKLLFYDSILDLMLHVYKFAEYDELETIRLTNLPHVYVVYVVYV